MRELSDEGERVVADVARRHGVSAGAVTTLLAALSVGNGTQAQFSHPDVGGMGQWSRGGMIMVSDMFNHELRRRVDALCTELSDLLRNSSLFAGPATPPHSPQLVIGGGDAGQSRQRGSTSRWPAGLGSPASSGSQNDLHYAIFPAQHRLAIERSGKLTVYDTADHVITGFSQQQSSDQSLSFTSQHGPVSIADLKLVPDAGQTQEPSISAPAATQVSPRPPRDTVENTVDADDDVFGKIERLAGLRDKELITDAEFQNKKAELLARL